MAQAYAGGATLQEIGDYHGITRERVRQLIRELGVTRTDGGQAKRGRDKAAAASRRRDQRYLAKYGMAFAEFGAINPPGSKRSAPIRLFQHQRQNAKVRNILWELTFAEWWGIWHESGKWKQRGRGVGKFVMARHGDSGPYAVGNVKIIASEQNNSEYIRRYWNEVRSGKRKPPAAFGGGMTRTHCNRGHALTSDNLYESATGRVCIACDRIRTAAYRARKKDRLSPHGVQR
jgi:hypothetical protein